MRTAPSIRGVALGSSPHSTTSQVQHRARARRLSGRPSRAESGRLLDTYLQISLQMFLSKGYEGASIEGIAREAKAGKMTLYRRFGSKAALFRVVAHQAITKARTKLQESLISSSKPQEVLPDLVLRLHLALTDPEYLAILRLVIAESQRFPELSDALLSDDRYLFEPVIAYLSKANAAGRLRIADPYAAAMQLAALASGGGRFLIKKPRTDRKSRDAWVTAVATFALDAWRP